MLEELLLPYTVLVVFRAVCLCNIVCSTVRVQHYRGKSILALQSQYKVNIQHCAASCGTVKLLCKLMLGGELQGAH